MLGYIESACVEPDVSVVETVHSSLKKCLTDQHRVFVRRCQLHALYRPQERGIEGTQPPIDDMAPLFHVRDDCPPLLLITGDCELDMLVRYEENAYMWRIADDPSRARWIQSRPDGRAQLTRLSVTPPCLPIDSEKYEGQSRIGCLALGFRQFRLPAGYWTPADRRSGRLPRNASVP